MSTLRFCMQHQAAYSTCQTSLPVWIMKQLGGGRELLMRAVFGLPGVRGGRSSCRCSTSRATAVLTNPSIESLDKRAPITVVSVIQVEDLKIVNKSGYQAFSCWVSLSTSCRHATEGALGSPQTAIICMSFLALALPAQQFAHIVSSPFKDAMKIIRPARFWGDTVVETVRT